MSQAIKVKVPVNPASLINVQPLKEGLLDGALPAVYKHKTQSKDKSLCIMYVNLSDKYLIISPNQLIGHGSMLLQSKSKPKVNVVKQGVKDPAITEKIWAGLKLNENIILNENTNIRQMLYSMIDDNQDIFTTSAPEYNPANSFLLVQQF